MTREKFLVIDVAHQFDFSKIYIYTCEEMIFENKYVMEEVELEDLFFVFFYMKSGGGACVGFYASAVDN